MIRINRWTVAAVVLLVLGALFIDGYSLFYRYAVVHIPLGQTLKDNPHIGSRDVYLHKGLDLQGGTELTIAICRGNDNPPGAGCRSGPKSSDMAAVQQGVITVLNQRVNGLGVAESTVQAQGDDKVLVQLPGIGLDQAKAAIGTTAQLHFATAVSGAPDPSNLATDQQNLYDPAEFSDPLKYPSGYHWKFDPNIDASDVTKADVGYDQTSNQIAVIIDFDSKGAAEWQKVTDAASKAPSGTPANQVAIFLDNHVLTAPGVVSASSNSTQITGGFTQDSATLLAQQISAGALPAQIGVVQASEVSATLGQETVRKSLIAGAVGLLIVVLFMIGYYRFPGLLASLALLCYAAIVLAIYKLFGVTVSLAGLAGFVLSVGMAVDANVLIFERTRDELRHGRGTALAVETGFRRAFPAIRDSNLSTLIACALLAFFGTSVVKGFAITLAVGVCVSFVTAVLITRSFFAVILGMRRGTNPRLYTQIHEEYEAAPPLGRFDIVRSRNLYFLGSLLIIIPGVLAILVWGFRLGLDFSGGNRIDVHLHQTAAVGDVQTVVDQVAKAYHPTVQAEAGNHFSIQTLPSPIDTIQSVISSLDKRFGIEKASNKLPDVQVTQVGPTIARDLVGTAVLLVLVSSLCIAVYLAFAFRGQRAISARRFSVCTFFKLLHDVFVLAGIWAILGHFSDLGQVDSLFVTAILTSVSFSIHDTIVVFDRIRENLRVGPRLTFDQIINLSTAQTMTRSLNTALTVVFVLLALVLFGGDTIRGFVLALLIGIVTGTYSSIFNASTLLVAWQSVRGSQTPPTRGPTRGVARVPRVA